MVTEDPHNFRDKTVRANFCNFYTLHQWVKTTYTFFLKHNHNNGVFQSIFRKESSNNLDVLTPNMEECYVNVLGITRVWRELRPQLRSHTFENGITIGVTQCENLTIFLPLIFYVKSISVLPEYTVWKNKKFTLIINEMFR